MTYIFIITAAVVIIISYFFNIFSRKTNIPSVLLLIILGVALKAGTEYFGIQKLNLFPILEVLGIIGLIMIVLEAALDLELNLEKWPIIWKSFAIAFLSLGVSVLSISFLMTLFIDISLIMAILYAVPLSIISSAIVIPSIKGLTKQKQEYMIYESTFSDILGIMFFYFVLDWFSAKSALSLSFSFVFTVAITIIISIIASYFLILIFQNIKTKVKLFMLISVLVALYSIGKMFHLSSLIIILIFGLFLRNPLVFFKGKLKRFLNEQSVNEIFTDFSLITIESSFVVRTYFFIIFGMTLSLATILNFKVVIISLLGLILIFSIRWIMMRIFLKHEFFPEILIAPRGLISILLFFSIPKNLIVPNFESGILLFTIIVTSILMTYSLVRYNKIITKKKPKEKIKVIDNSKFKIKPIKDSSIFDKHRQRLNDIIHNDNEDEDD